MFRNMKIGARLLLLVALLNAALVGVGLLGLHGMQANDAALDTVYQDRVVPLRDLKVVADMYAVNIVDTANKAGYGTITAEQAQRSVDQAEATIRSTWAGYLATYLVDREKELVAQAGPLMHGADQHIAQLRRLLGAGDRVALARFTAGTLYPVIEPISDKLSELIDLQLTVARQEYEVAEARYDRLQTLAIVIILMAVLGGLALGVAIVRSVTGPLRRVSTALHRMSQGELEADVVDDGRRDEIGTMIRAAAAIIATIRAVEAELRDVIEAARAGSLSVRADPARHPGRFAELVGGVNDLAETLSTPLFEVASVMARLASGDVRGRMAGAYEGDLRALKGNVNRSLDTLVALLDEISGFAAAMAEGDVTSRITGSYQGDFATISGNLNKAAAQLAGVIREVVASTGQVSLAAHETTAAAFDVSRQAAGQMTTLEEVSAAISQVAAAVGEIARNAERGRCIALEAVGMAEQGQARLIEMTGAVDGIATGNARISKVSGLIASIADKTYVLALNAGLEAVRAGEQGQGFGLIAHEITKLAEESGRATHDIRGMLDEADQRVREGVATAGAAGEAIGRIVEAVRESGAAVQAIAAAIEEQNAMTGLMTDRLAQLSVTGQNTAGAAEEISATMQSLSDMAGRLQEQAGRIRAA